MTRAEIVSAITAALAEIHERGDTFEIRALPAAGKGAPARGYFRDFRLAAEAAATLDAGSRYAGIYVTLNPVNPALYARCADRIDERGGASTGDSDIVRRRWILVDLDSSRPSGISASDEEQRQAFTRADVIVDALSAEDFPAPFRASSGNGVHLLYRVDLPNDSSSLALVERFLKRLNEEFGDESVKVDTSVANASRIVRLYGTTARKGDNIADRPHRRSRLLPQAQSAEAA